jgi:hypothetical protein
LAISYDGGYTFERMEQPVISAKLHYEELIRNGYYFGPKETLGMIDELDGTFMTLRDHFLYMEEGILHIFFGIKAAISINGGYEIKNAIGHAEIRDCDNWKSREICEPIFVTNEQGFNQCELSNLVKRGDLKIFCFSDTERFTPSQPRFFVYLEHTFCSVLLC